MRCNACKISVLYKVNKNSNLTELNGRPVRLLIGGSPCTAWAICQKKNRETEARGEGWELFRNYLIAKEKFQPDFFLYENNKSASQAIKNQICEELGYPLQIINSALVSAQQRYRFYVKNWDCPQPEDRGILLKDILESGIVEREKSYCLKHQAGNTRDYLKKHHTQVAFEPIRIGTIENNAKNQDFDSQQYRVYSPEGKSVTICGQGGGVGAKTGLYATNIKFLSEKEMEYMLRETSDGRNHFDFKHHSSTTDDKSACVVSNFSKGVPYNVLCESIDGDGNYLIDGKLIYTIKDKKIVYKGKEYNINLPDGHYIIRKLTVKECERLQTMPDGYVDGIVSDTQAYKCLGNGWTAEVIIHLLNYGLKNVPKDYPIEVLSMYDGIATGRYCLDKLGYTNITYKAYEIDEYAKKVAMKNYPDIIQCGDAFDLRNDDWEY
jgi:DNA (cytosine-5)-methyltransferase 3A